MNNNINGILFDLDGTVYRDGEAVPGVSDFVKEIKKLGIIPLFVTNRANRTPETIKEHLNELNIECSCDDILTSSQATASYLKPGRFYYIGEEGLEKPLKEAGMEYSEDNVDYVIVGFDREFNYNKLLLASNLIYKGAEFIATNPDTVFPVQDGIVPGTGTFLKAIEAATNKKPTIIGKPKRIIFDMALKRINLQQNEVIAVGDNIDTDIKAGHNAGMRTALILSGISTKEDAEKSTLKPTWIIDTYEELLTIIKDSKRI